MSATNVHQLLSDRFAAAIRAIAPELDPNVDPVVRTSGDPKFGDYQCNAAMSLAKTLKGKPREVAEKIVAAVDLNGIADTPLEIAGPGFINIRLKSEFLAASLLAVSETSDKLDRVGIPRDASPQTIVIDYSSPNVAKQMHVGHLRGTIIGDSFARLLAFLGHNVIRQNHVGDWGTQFGILIEYYRTHPVPAAAPGGSGEDVLAAIEDDYRAANDRFKNDPAFATAARAAVGQLQSGDAAAREIWTRLYALSRAAFNEIYRRLDVLLTDDDLRGESSYNQWLAEVVAELRTKLATRRIAPTGESLELRDDAGAVCLFFYGKDAKPLFVREDGNELPMIIQKSDGAYLYATTDLAALRYRTRDLHAQRIIYVVGNEQSEQLRMLFIAGKCIGWVTDAVDVEHAGHGLILGKDRKRLRTREGGTIKLRALLDEAVQRSRAVVDENEARKETEGGAARLPDSERQQIAERVGIAAVKYADLSRDRNTDYIFDFDTMLAMNGNTAPYMLYAYARIRSIYRKAATEFGSPNIYAPDVALRLDAPAERALALRLARFSEMLANVARDLTPHVLCTYLYDLAGDFNRFYESCPVLQAPDEPMRLARMRLCDLTARTLKLALYLLGIETIERM